MGMGNVDIAFKRKVWEWMFAMPADEIAIRYGIGLQLSLSGKAISEEDKIENKIPGYKEMSQDEKIEAQKKYFGIKSVQANKLLNTKPRRAD